MKTLLSILTLFISFQACAEQKMEAYMKEAFSEPGALSQEAHDIFWIRMRDGYGNIPAEKIAGQFRQLNINMQELQFALWSSALLSEEQGKIVYTDEVNSEIEDVVAAMEQMLIVKGIDKESILIQSELSALEHDIKSRKARFNFILDAAVKGNSVDINGKGPVIISESLIHTVMERIQFNKNKLDDLLSPNWLLNNEKIS
ncbi:MAG: hypothetical protein HRU20_00510 [Pseudomonadales bacterium]|nr:hypothetical protein [Pseudomonadales bacterium]